jgi:hypothetical protein
MRGLRALSRLWQLLERLRLDDAWNLGEDLLPVGLAGSLARVAT